MWDTVMHPRVIDVFAQHVTAQDFERVINYCVPHREQFEECNAQKPVRNKEKLGK
jgi:hypothetical protein